MILNLPHDLHTPRAPVQRLPDFQQHPFPIFSPLMIPEAKFLDVLRCEELLALPVLSYLFGQAMLKSVQFNRQPSGRTVGIEEVFPHRMLATEFESGKSPRPQSLPKFLFLVRLFTAKPPCVGYRIHRGKGKGKVVPRKPLPPYCGEREFFRCHGSKSGKTALERQIATTDAQIDRLVYDLYGLTEEEIKIVEGNA
jgi:hypothetical protein